jgi:hypothetical protein
MTRALAVALAAAAATALTVAAGPAAVADQHEPPPIPPHPHLLLVGAEVDFSGEVPVLLDYVRCVDVAANRALPLNAHHEHVHFGRAGEALTSAGHLFIPAAPAFDLPWTDCASFLAIFD